MIVQLRGTSAESTREASLSLQALSRSWGHPAAAEVPAPPALAHGGSDEKAIDPVALASLILSVPSAALAVSDLADRIRKRKRAAELIEHARELDDKRVTATVLHSHQVIELSSLTPDQLLDLIEEDSPSE